MSRMWIVGLMTGLMWATPASAQDPGVASEIERTASASPSEVRSFVANAVGTIRDLSREVSKSMEQARGADQQDTIECLSSRLASLRALQQVAERAEALVNDPTTPASRLDIEFRKAAVGLEKAQKLHAEAGRCTGGDVAEAGEVIVESLGGDDDFGDDIPFDPDDKLWFDIDPVGDISPFE